MKSLGYPRLISIDNFRLPNFELVADCLYWLMQRCEARPPPCRRRRRRRRPPSPPLHHQPTPPLSHRYHPECDIPDEIATEQQRVRFLQAAAALMLAKGRVKLSIRKLYSADGLAVQELLKLAQLLHRARASAAQPEEVRRRGGCSAPAARTDPASAPAHHRAAAAAAAGLARAV
jgi:clusterin-associated protein 1